MLHCGCVGRDGRFVLLPEGGDHSAIIFDLPEGEVLDRSKPLMLSNMPAPSETFVGRESEMHRAVVALTGAKRRCVVLVGAGGIGKTALSIAVATYVRLRHVFDDGTYHVDARGLESVASLTFAIASALQLPGTSSAELDESVLREVLLSALSTKQVLPRVIEPARRCNHERWGRILLLTCCAAADVLVLACGGAGATCHRPVRPPVNE